MIKKSFVSTSKISRDKTINKSVFVGIRKLSTGFCLTPIDIYVANIMFNKIIFWAIPDVGTTEPRVGGFDVSCFVFLAIFVSLYLCKQL